jgi:predicted MPP superfamily phosphohydrolase
LPGNDETQDEASEVYSPQGLISNVTYRGTPIAIAGVEPTGITLTSATEILKGPLTIADSLFKILLIHDPGSWLLSAVSGSIPQLTVAGHTHGFQAALPFAIWYPASLVHERWKGFMNSGLSSLCLLRSGLNGNGSQVFHAPGDSYHHPEGRLTKSI